MHVMMPSVQADAASQALLEGTAYVAPQSLQQEASEDIGSVPPLVPDDASVLSSPRASAGAAVGTDASGRKDASVIYVVDDINDNPVMLTTLRLVDTLQVCCAPTSLS